MFEQYLRRWGLVPDGDPIITTYSRLLPARRDGEPVIVKLAVNPEEKVGGALMAWWAGDGAARVLAHEGDALLLERADDDGKLMAMARTGRDDEASRIICAVVTRLHQKRDKPLPELAPLDLWFRALGAAARTHGGIFVEAAKTARELLDDPREVVVLHGDIHHQNVLDFGTHGWLAIDPKGLLGERGYDYANTFCNPDVETATTPGRMARQVEVVADAAGLDRRRLLKWVFAYSGLSQAWFLEDDGDAAVDLSIAEIALAELAK